MPAYNERPTIERAIDEVLAAPYDVELLIVDDGSTDGTREYLHGLDRPGVRVFFHERNQGKGAAVRTGFAQVRGDVVLIQDADLECTPKDYPRLLEPILEGYADVVFGSRFIGGGGVRVVGSYRHALGNRLLTWLSNVMTDLNLTDMEVGYKVMKADVMRRLDLRCDRFGIEPELTAKIARLGVTIYEVPITYHGRSFDQGKKIGWKDGIAAVYFIVRFGVGLD